MRLADGVAAPDGSAQSGRLEVLIGGGWSTVCDKPDYYDYDESITPASAAVACSQLGFSNSFHPQPPVRRCPHRPPRPRMAGVAQSYTARE